MNGTWRVILADYINHYNTGRSHQGEGMGLRAPDDDPDLITFSVPAARIQSRARLAGLIGEYRQAAQNPRPAPVAGFSTITGQLDLP